MFPTDSTNLLEARFEPKKRSSSFSKMTATDSDASNNRPTLPAVLDSKRCKYPFCIVWTPIPLLTWLFPFIGHMGIAYSTGVIRDFAGPYYVSEDEMAFGRPTKFWVLDPDRAQGGAPAWDRAIFEASEEYSTRMHNLCCDNCHSHVAYALNLMSYGGSKSWNMIWLALYMLPKSKYVSFTAFLKTWVPFLIIAGGITALALFT